MDDDMNTDREAPLKRTHTCGELRLEDKGAAVRLCGWVASFRDLGGVLFVVLRDREGTTQVTFNPDRLEEDIWALACRVRQEWVLSVAGTVGSRGEDRNPDMATGDIEVVAEELVVLNRSDILPFEPAEYGNVSEENRMKYRYLDLRRSEMMGNLRLRAAICRAIRVVLDRKGFVEVETPFLTKSTPEGARDFIVPSRLQRGEWYALPQSPQLFKQILMVGGLDKYYQIVRCFRDEDLRADRQPEFTQLDVEMSFCDETDVMAVTDEVLRRVCAISGCPFPDTVPVMTYEEAMRRYGTDRPDTRFGMELVDCGDLAAETEFAIFTRALEAGGAVGCICLPGGAALSRKQTDGLGEWVGEFGAKGLAVTKIEDGALTGGIAKFLVPVSAALIERMGAKNGDMLCFVADRVAVVRRSLGELRCKLAAERGMIDPVDFRWVWIVDFPFCEWSEQNERWEVLHHPFTAPKIDRAEDLEESGPAGLLSRAYDIVCNGVEIGGGSVRIHRTEMQKKVFEVIGISAEEADLKFGFLLDALRYGAPPHGGIALGLDRVAMMMAGAGSIRDVIAFPKTMRGTCPLTGAPAPVGAVQLDELGIELAAGDE